MRVSDQAISEQLNILINSETRSEELRARNRYRHPLETLMFFEVRPEQTVVEIWPGGQGGWHRSIMEPLFSSGFGTYIPVLDAAAFPAPVAEVADGDAIFRMLKPGGIFGIADHRGNESVPQDPRAVDGYVKQSHVVMLAERAGFELVDQAEINANSQGHETQS